MSTPSGQPPKTWYGEDGHRNKFLANWWNVKKIKDLHWEVSIEPKPKWPNPAPHDKQFLQRIEYGGSFVTKPLVKGYLVTFQDEAQGRQGRKQRFSHRRIAFQVLKGKAKYVTVRPHPFVDATVKRVRKTIRERRDKNQLKIPFGDK